MDLPLENDVAQFPNRLPMTSGVAQAKPDAASEGQWYLWSLWLTYARCRRSAARRRRPGTAPGIAKGKPNAAFDGHRHWAVVGTVRLPAEAPFERIDCGLFRCGSMRSSSLVSARLILERASLPNATGVPESACRSANVICSS